MSELQLDFASLDQFKEPHALPTRHASHGAQLQVRRFGRAFIVPGGVESVECAGSGRAGPWRIYTGLETRSARQWG